MDILNISEHIRILEELLLHQDFSLSPESLEAMLAEDFREVSPDGAEIKREAVLRWLLNKSAAARWQFSDFKVHILAPGLAQATYHARQINPVKNSSRGAIHSSLWRQNESEKCWQLLFHQSTRVS